MSKYQLPEIALTPIDIINRRAAATGSMRYAQLASDADYNGHRVTVSFKPHAVSGPTWNAEYYWGGRVVIGRGTFSCCLAAAKDEYAKGAHGCQIVVYLSDEASESIADQASRCVTLGFEPYTQDDHKPPYWTGTHEAVSNALSWENQGRFIGMVQHALTYTGTADDWETERNRWLDARRAA